MPKALPASTHAAPARTVLAYVSGWTFTVLESSLLSRECVHLSSVARVGGLVPLALTLRPDLVVLEWTHDGRNALMRVQANPVAGRLRVAVAASPVIAKKMRSDLLLLPAHEPDEWDRLLGEWLDIPHRSELRMAVSLPASIRNVAGPQTQPGVILDLSRNGALIRTDAAVAVGTVVALRFTLPGAHEVESLAVVRRQARDSQGYAHGMRFVDVDAHAEHLIGEFLRATRDASPEGTVDEERGGASPRRA